MPRFFVSGSIGRGLACALLGLGLSCAPGESVDEQSRPIYHGDPDHGDPAVAYLGFGDGSGGGWACTGTLISPHVIITAKHCINAFRDARAFFGHDPGSGNGTWIDIVDSREHASDDVAMVALRDPGPATPVPVNHRNLGPYVGGDVHIIGYGGADDGTGGTKNHGWTKIDEVQGNQIITGYDGPSHLCFGDSGGPNMMTFDGKEHVIAINSWIGGPCGGPPNGSYRVDIHYAWIQAYIDEREGGGGPDPDPPEGVTLVARHSGRCMDVSGSGTADGTNIQQWTCNGTGAQAFRIEDVGGGYARLVNTHSSKCVDVAGSSTANGANIQLWTCNGTGAQDFRLEDRGGGYYRLRNRTSNKCAEVTGAGQSDGSDIAQRTCGSGTHQQFRID